MHVRHVGEPSGARAFTLIEVLVVVTIIGLLVSILLGPLSTARERARQVVCASNLHQIGVNIQMYIDRYRCFPPVSTEKGEAGRWPRLISEVRAKRNATSNPRSSLMKVMTCPTVPDRDKALKINNHRMDRDIAYGYNYIYLGDSRWLWKPGKGRFPVPASRIKCAGQTVMITDSDGTGGWCRDPDAYTPEGANPNAIGHHGFMIDPPALPADAENGPAFTPAQVTKADPSEKAGFSRVSNRHWCGASVLFVDGHANWVIRKYLEGSSFPWNGHQSAP